MILYYKTVEPFSQMNMSNILGYNDFEVYLINLERNKERLESFIKQYERCDLRVKQIKRFEAIDGKKLENIETLLTPKAFDEIKEIETSGYRTKHYQLTRGAIGCYLSHLAVYELIANNTFPYGFIFEDDVLIDRYILKKLNKMIIRIPDDWDLLFLSCQCLSCKSMELYYDVGKFFLTHCYVVKKSSAAKILNLLKNKRISRQIDSELSHLVGLKKLKIYCLKENLCKQSGVFQTTIQTPLKVVKGINPWSLE